MLRERVLHGGARLALVRGDLTRMDVDAVVNAANEDLRHGGGLAGALARAAGPTLQQESDAWVRHHGRVPTGHAVLTGAGDLPALWVIHAVGPVWRGGGHDEERLLRGAVHAALALAREHRLDSVALPAISAGIYGYPKPDCARTILAALADWLDPAAGAGPSDVRLVLRDDDVLEAFLHAWDARWPA